MKLSIKVKILITVVISGAVISIGGYFSIKQYQGFQQQKIESERKSKEQQDLMAEQQKALEQMKVEIESITDAQKADEQAQKKSPSENGKPSLSSIIKQWQQVIVYIQCDFYYKGTNEKYLTQAGSGILERESFYNNSRGVYSAEVNVLTNKHVVLDEIYGPKNCTIFIPGYSPLFVDNSFSLSKKTVSFSSAGYDWAVIEINNPPNYIENIAYKLNRCNNRPSIGDDVVILGYPSIGSQSSITATEGIISGFDGDYYITSAKVEHGNSGGATILLKDNCYLGIPTYVIAGEIESLARILDSRVIFGY